MKRFVHAVLALAICVCPMALHASIWHTTQQKAVPHQVVKHPGTRHYSQKAQRHEVVKQEHVRYYTHKAKKHKTTHHTHKNRVKKHHAPTA